MMNAEYRKETGCPQMDSAEHEEYVGAQSAGGQEVKEQDGADLLERIWSRENLNKAYKRVRANKGAPGVDGILLRKRCPG
jgi:group II intron-encoding maturase